MLCSICSLCFFCSFVIKELIETEKLYVEDLAQIVLVCCLSFFSVKAENMLGLLNCKSDFF